MCGASESGCSFCASLGTARPQETAGVVTPSVADLLGLCSSGVWGAPWTPAPSGPRTLPPRPLPSGAPSETCSWPPPLPTPCPSEAHSCGLAATLPSPVGPSERAPDPLCSTPPAVLQGRRHGPRNRGLPGWDGGESPAERPLAPRGPTDMGRRTPAPGVRTELLPGEEVGALEGFPHSRLQSLGPSERLAGSSIPRLVGRAEPLQALAPANPRTRPHLARKEPPAHRRAWAGTGEADAPTRAATGAQGAGGPGAERGRAGGVLPAPAGGPLA